MDLPFSWVDVFADRPLTGNPLALIPDADALSDETMRAIAREFNQSETTFVVTPTRAAADVRLRSFTPGGDEVLGAGHNAMGAWIWLAGSGRFDAGRRLFVQQIGDELLEVEIDRGPTGARVTLDQSAPAFLHAAEVSAELAGALGIPPAGLASDAAAEVVSTGAAHLLVRAVDAATVDALRPEPSQLRRLLAEHGAEGCYVYAVTPDAGRIAYTRFFNPTVGIVEDPATGTAAGPLAALLVRDGIAEEGGQVRIEQGTALGRPSLLAVVVEGSRVRLSGSGLVVADGMLRL